MQNYEWYRQLKKPTWAPPSWLFGPVWTILYILIALSYGYVGYLFAIQNIPFVVLIPFILNLIFNLIFTPIQFGLKNNALAAVDILLVLGTIIWMLIAIYPFSNFVVITNIPYLLWVCFATILQLTILVLNWKN